MDSTEIWAKPEHEDRACLSTLTLWLVTEGWAESLTEAIEAWGLDSTDVLIFRVQGNLPGWQPVLWAHKPDYLD